MKSSWDDTTKNTWNAYLAGAGFSVCIGSLIFENAYLADDTTKNQKGKSPFVHHRGRVSPHRLIPFVLAGADRRVSTAVDKFHQIDSILM